MSTLITASVETLVAAGGSYWQSADGEHRRVYFNDVLGLFGVQAQFYGSGNVQSAQLDGETISNSEFKKISADLAGAKIWVDLTDGRLLVKGFTSRYAGYDYVPHVAAAVRKRIAAAEQLTAQ